MPEYIGPEVEVRKGKKGGNWDLDGVEEYVKKSVNKSGSWDFSFSEIEGFYNGNFSELDGRKKNSVLYSLGRSLIKREVIKDFSVSVKREKIRLAIEV